MNAISTKTFKSGNSVAVRLPKALGYAADVEVVIERNGDTLIVRPASDPAEEKRKLLDLVAALRALPKPDSVEKRAKPIPPVRPGL